MSDTDSGTGTFDVLAAMIDRYAEIDHAHQMGEHKETADDRCPRCRIGLP